RQSLRSPCAVAPTRRGCQTTGVGTWPGAACGCRAGVHFREVMKDSESPLAFLVRSADMRANVRSEEHTSELQSRENLVCRLLLDISTTHPHPLSLHDALPISTISSFSVCCGADEAWLPDDGRGHVAGRCMRLSRWSTLSRGDEGLGEPPGLSRPQRGHARER